MARRPGAIGQGYLPKGGAAKARELNAEAAGPVYRCVRCNARLAGPTNTGECGKHGSEALVSGVVDGNLAAAGPAGVAGRPRSVPASTAPGGPARAGARQRAGRAVASDWLALVGAVAGSSALLAELLHVVVGR